MTGTSSNNLEISHTESFISHPFQPVWNSESRVLILGTMPSPKSREEGFYYMHPKNRFWEVLSEIYGENPLSLKSIEAKKAFLIKRHIAIWDLLSSCQIKGALDSSIKNASPNDFTKIIEDSNIQFIFCTGNTSYKLWKKFCSQKYEAQYDLKVFLLPSTSPANAKWSRENLIEEYKILPQLTQNPATD